MRLWFWILVGVAIGYLAMRWVRWWWRQRQAAKDFR